MSEAGTEQSDPPVVIEDALGPALQDELGEGPVDGRDVAGAAVLKEEALEARRKSTEVRDTLAGKGTVAVVDLGVVKERDVTRVLP